VRHFEEQLNELRKRLLEMSGLVEAAIYRSVQCLVEGDEKQANIVFQNEARINQMQIEIDDLATAILALEQPVATDLRFITAATRINSELERMGDLAVNTAERALSLLRKSAPKPLIDVAHLAHLVESMVRKALDAFVRKDAELARTVLTSDDAVDELRDAIYTELIETMQNDASLVESSVEYLFIARNLERIADHATNIAEDVLFLVEGVDVRHHAEVRRAG